MLLRGFEILLPLWFMIERHDANRRKIQAGALNRKGFFYNSILFSSCLIWQSILFFVLPDQQFINS